MSHASESTLTDEPPLCLHNAHNIVGIDVMSDDDEWSTLRLKGEELIEMSIGSVDEVSRGKIHRIRGRRRNRT